MPAKVGDPVNVALRLSLAARDSPGELDKRLVSTATQVLNTKIEYEKSDTFNTSVLDSLKHKYITINTDSRISNGRPSTPHLQDTSVSGEMRPEPDSVLPTPKVILFPAERVQLGWRGNYPVGSGMLNVGNTCYLNATLQALFHIPSLVNWLQSDTAHLNKCTVANGSLQSECLICAVNKTLKSSQNKSGNVIKPYLIINRLKSICKHMGHGQQEDAHEFLRYLIENMGEAFLVRYKGENLDSYSKETTPLNQIFGGYMRTEVTCLQCRGVSTTFQHFQELLLDIRRASTLDDALAGYFQRERLDGDDAYRCERCNKKVSATKKFSIEKPPHVLCIQLKRFSVVGVKLNKHVSFTQRLDLTRFLCPQSSYRLGSQPLAYRLVSMVTHMGSSVHCGHYTAIAQTSTGHFYHFDDSSVRPISLNAALDTNTYIIIYEMERIDGRPHQNFIPTTKPATVTSGTSLSCNGTAQRSISLPSLSHSTATLKTSPVLSPMLQKPAPSIIPVLQKPAVGSSNSNKQHSVGIMPAVHKPNAPLPPAKERDRVTFGLQPRLLMQIKNGKVCQETTKSSLVPYESGDSSGSENERSTKKPDMPRLESSPEKQMPSPSKTNSSLVRQVDGNKSPPSGISFHRKSEEPSSSCNTTGNNIDLPAKNSPPKIMELPKVQKGLKLSSNLDNMTVAHKGSENVLSPAFTARQNKGGESMTTTTVVVRNKSNDNRKVPSSFVAIQNKIGDIMDSPSLVTSHNKGNETSMPVALAPVRRSKGSDSILLALGTALGKNSDCKAASSLSITGRNGSVSSTLTFSHSKGSGNCMSPSVSFPTKATNSCKPSPSPATHTESREFPAKVISDSSKTRRADIESCARRKINTGLVLKSAANSASSNSNACSVESLQVNTLSGVGHGKSTSSSWQVTDMALHSPSCHSESSTNSVASSTTSWAVSDVKRKSSKKLLRTIPDTSMQSFPQIASVPDKKTDIDKYPSDLDIGQLSRSPSSSHANCMDRLSISPLKSQSDVSISIPGVHHGGKEEMVPMTLNQTTDPKVDTSHKDWNRNKENKSLSHCNGGSSDTASKEDNESDEYEWVEKTHESLGLSRCNGQVNGWNEKNRGEVGTYLLRESHQGYGPSVNSWSGGRSHVDREADNERREERKRSFSKQYDDELDMGRVKKVKHRNTEFGVKRHKPNCFDEFRNKWNNFRNAPYYDSHHSCKMFYNSKKYRNNHYHNGYHRRKYSHHRTHYSTKEDHWRR